MFLGLMRLRVGGSHAQGSRIAVFLEAWDDQGMSLSCDDQRSKADGGRVLGLGFIGASDTASD